MPSSPDGHRPDRLTLLAFLAMVVILGMNFVGVRFSNRELDPVWGATFRFLLASLVLLVIAWARRIPLPTRGTRLWGALAYGILNFALFYALMYWGMVHVTAGTASVILATLPLITLLMAVPAGLERFRLQAIAGALVVVVGVALAFGSQLRADVPLPSLLAVVAAAFCGAAAGITVKLTPRMHPVAMNAVALPAGTLLLAGFTLATGDTVTLPTRTDTWVALAYLVFSTVVGFLLLVWILGRWTASATSYALVLMPFVAVAGGVLLDGERLTTLFLAGGAIVLIGVYLGAIRGRAKTSKVPPPPDPAGAGR